MITLWPGFMYAVKFLSSCLTLVHELVSVVKPRRFSSISMLPYVHLCEAASPGATLFPFYSFYTES